ncbi:MAG: T9SS type A sorting domain-containing protein, partial [Chitinophagales bacterium]|nr:T9SS type A sorting domain-containing protein [Chitinophagales bacterium]
MKKLFYLLCFLVCVKFSAAQTYTVPGAQVQPAWVFPLWFEDGCGARDTLYFCYDSLAGMGIGDTIFGVKKEVVDTTKFQAYYFCALGADLLAYRKLTTLDLWNGADICFINIQMPLIFRWDPKVFYSDSLPFPDQSPAPKAQGRVYFDLPMQVNGCSFESALMLTDTIKNPLYGSCYFTDSIYFGGSAATYVSFRVEQWTGLNVGINEPLFSGGQINIFPNPAYDKIHFEKLNPSENWQLEIYTVSGVLMRSYTSDHLTRDVSIGDLPAAPYL